MLATGPETACVVRKAIRFRELFADHGYGFAAITIMIIYYICYYYFCVARVVTHAVATNLLYCRRRSTSAPFGRRGSYGEANAAKAAVVNVTRSESHASSPGVARTETRRGIKISSL